MSMTDVRVSALDELLRVTLLVRRHIEQVAERFDVSPPGARLLLALDRPLRMAEAAQQSACEPSHLTAVADALQQAGLLVREPDPADKRARRLVLTEEGLALREKIVPALLTDAPVVASLSDRECKALVDLLSTDR